MNEVSELKARLEVVETQLASMRQEFKAAAHELRQEDAFMRPVSQTVADHVSSHWFDKAARRLLWVVLGGIGAAAFGLAMWVSGRNFK